MPKIVKFIISLGTPLLIGVVGGIFTSSSVQTWYREISKPSFTPPSWVFGPAWTLLYILMGISFYLVWVKNFGGRAQFILPLYAGQLLLNLLWSLFFFGLKNPLLGLFDIVFLWLLILLNVYNFWKVSLVSGVLLIPYLMWVTFATALNAGVVLLNK
ncbi:MAG: TspO/MBR family protein [candidate division WOR-3 bacterium]